MKKKILLIVVFLFVVTSAYAQRRGALTNVYETWTSVTTSPTTITFPVNSRDVFILNGSATDVCVDLTGDSTDVEGGCTTPGSFQLDGAEQIALYDFVTSSIILKTISGTASPVSVITTW